MKSISPQELATLMGSGRPIDLIDVRQAGEYRRGHVPGACLLPLAQVNAQAVQALRKAGEGEPIYIICQSGGRSRAACDQLIDGGLANVVNVEGGTSAWKRAGLPIDAEASRGHGLPLWARIAGFLAILISLVLGITLQPAFLFIALVAWFSMILAGGGACPLDVCGTSDQRPV